MRAGDHSRRSVALCVVALCTVAASAQDSAFGVSPHGHAAKAALNSAASKDPLAKRDSYAELSTRDKEYWVRCVLAVCFPCLCGGETKGTV